MATEMETMEKKEVEIIFGANMQKVAVVGQPISSIRRTMAEVLTLPDQAKALVGGKEVREGYVLQEGDELEFVKPSGGKG